MIQTQTFEYNEAAKDEMKTLARALSLMADKRYDEAAKVLTARHDELTREPVLKLYDQR